MTIVHDLDQHYVDTQLVCPPGKSRIEISGPDRSGLYIEVRASAPGRGTYYLRHKDKDGTTRHHMIGKTGDIPLDDAIQRAAELKTSLRSAVSQTQPATTPTTAVPLAPACPEAEALSHNADRMTLDRFMQEHYFPWAKVHKRSWTRDEQLYRLRIKPKFGDQDMGTFTRLQASTFQAELLKEGLSHASVNHHLQLLRKVFNLALSYELISRNVLTRFNMLMLDNRVDRFLQDDQVETLVAVLQEDKNRMVALIFLFLLATGARLDEALKAEWGQFDLESGTWRVPATNSKSKRVMHKPLNTSALWVLQQLDTRERSAFLFPSPATGKPYTTITRQWYRIRKKAGIGKEFRIHDLRHTFASRMVSRGRSLPEVQKLLGHADSRTTERYAHVAMKSAREASNAAAFEIRSGGTTAN